MSKENMRVMEKLIGQCRQAYQAKKPLIMVDTEDIDLMDRLARDSKLVDFYEEAEKAYLMGKNDEKKYVKYYKYAGHLPDALAKGKNFSYCVEDLKELTAKGGHLSYGKGPMMLVEHLTQDDTDKINCLRSYVHSYVRCRYNDSALRSSCVLLYGDPGALPPDLLRYTEILTVEYPNQAEIKEILQRITEENGHPALDENVANEVSELMIGFSLTQVEEYVRRLLWIDGENGRPMLFSKKRKKVLLDAKAQAIRSTGGLLTLYREKDDDGKGGEAASSKDENGLGGMGAYKKWAKEAGEHTKSNSGYALERGVPAMKGVLLCGVPGCGKSEAAKILHREWKLPMLRLDVDQLMGGLLGESERNMRQALALAEAMSPCILWIDEIEKGFGGAASDQGDGGTFKRMFGRLLTWMQENKKPCFIFATANDIGNLPPEFFRSGRFDALFSVYMPTNAECKEIFAEQMRRADKLRRNTAAEQGNTKEPAPLFDEKCFEDAALQGIMDLVMQGKNPKEPKDIKFMSGADIEKVTVNALKKIPGEKLGKPIDPTTWKNVLAEVIHDPTITTQGSGYAGLDKIAACYVRLMRENFVPVSHSSQCLFRKESYKTESVDDLIKVTYTGTCTLNSGYDKAMFNTLKERIERIATKVETNALERVCW